jgi:fatty-acyl-CoA synthase
MNTESPIAPAVRRQTLSDILRRTALRLPIKTAIVCGNNTWTYAEFDALVSRLTAGLNSIGVREGDKVAVLARNSHGFAALRFALARRGAVLVL